RRRALFPLELDQRVHLHALFPQPVGPAERRQVDHEGGGDDLAARFLDEVDGRVRRSAGRDQIIDQQYLVSAADGIGVDLDGVDAVLEAVLLADRLPRQLALLADRHEAAAEFVGDGAAEDEAARLDARNMVDLATQERPYEFVDRGAEADRIGYERGDVAELDAGLGVVRDGPDQALDVHSASQFHASRTAATGRSPVAFAGFPYQIWPPCGSSDVFNVRLTAGITVRRQSPIQDCPLRRLGA